MDGTVEVIREYESRLTWWVSEPNRGMYDAINKGFGRTTGEVMGYLNRDDLYFPWFLQVVRYSRKIRMCGGWRRLRHRG